MLSYDIFPSYVHDPSFFKLDLHASRPHSGQNLVAQRLRSLLHSEFYPSAIYKSHVNCGKVQDAYSIRCIPQVSFHLIERIFNVMNNSFLFVSFDFI